MVVDPKSAFPSVTLSPDFQTLSAGVQRRWSKGFWIGHPSSLGCHTEQAATVQGAWPGVLVYFLMSLARGAHLLLDLVCGARFPALGSPGRLQFVINEVISTWNKLSGFGSLDSRDGEHTKNSCRFGPYWYTSFH